MSKGALKKCFLPKDYAILTSVFDYNHLKLASPDHISS